MRYLSTNRQAPPVSFREALLNGQAPDKGLYFPEKIPRFSDKERKRWPSLSYAQLATEILAAFLEGEIETAALQALCEEAYDFAIPIEAGGAGRYLLRLDQGPTASFKDFAARAMARMISRFLHEEGRELLILTATSGDTGSAIAHAFYQIPCVRVVVLFPQDEVSERQRRLMTTLGQNIHAVAIQGKFDDCQAFVKKAFSDPSLASLPLSSANSINIGRLLPQSVYYAYTWAQITQGEGDIVFVVPSGNFGNLMGARIAQAFGTPIRHLVAAVNENDAFPRYLASGHYEKIVPSRNCLSNAMNVGHPSNLARLVHLYRGQMDESGTIHLPPVLDEMRADIFSISVSDAETTEAMRDAYNQGILLEPHGAVGWFGLQAYEKAYPALDCPRVLVETAHPAKFPEAIQAVLHLDPELPDSLRASLQAEEDYLTLPSAYEAFHAYLSERFLSKV